MSGENNEIRISLTLDGKQYIAIVNQADGTTKKFVLTGKQLQKVLEDNSKTTKYATGSVNDLNARLAEARKKFDELSPSAKNYQSALKRITVLKQHLSNVTKKATTDMAKFGAASGKTGFAILNMNRVVSDAPFGMIAISNNIEPLVQSFISLRKETGGTKAAFLALGKSMVGTLGIMTAVSLVTAAVTYFSLHTRSAKKDVDSITSSIEAMKKALDGLIEIKSPFDGLKYTFNAEDIDKSIKAVESIISNLESERGKILRGDEFKKLYNISETQLKSLDSLVANAQKLNLEKQNIAITDEKDLEVNKEILEKFKSVKKELEIQKRISKELSKINRESAKATIPELKEKIANIIKLRDETVNLTQAQADQFNKEIKGYQDRLAALQGNKKDKKAGDTNLIKIDFNTDEIDKVDDELLSIDETITAINFDIKRLNDLPTALKTDQVTSDISFLKKVIDDLKEGIISAEEAMQRLSNVVNKGTDSKEVKKATKNTAELKLKADIAQQSFTLLADSMIDAFAGVKLTIGEVLTDLGVLVAKLLVAAGIKFALVSAGIPAELLGIGGLATGGPTDANKPYFVGEEGMELFIPKTSGYVVSNQQLQQLSKTTQNGMNRLAFGGGLGNTGTQTLLVKVNATMKARKRNFVAEINKQQMVNSRMLKTFSA